MGLSDASASSATVLIVGGGLAGLFCALECKRNGLRPTVLESRQTTDVAGDFMTIGPSAVRAFERWPHLFNAYKGSAYNAQANYLRYTGEHIAGPMPVHPNFGAPILRPALARILLQAVLAEGIEVLYQCRVIKYSETEYDAGVELANGETLHADMVVAADGVHSKSWTVVSGQQPQIYSSGSATFRASYPIKHALKVPILRDTWAAASTKSDILLFFLGPSYGIVLLGKDTACWVWVHKDDPNTSSESWTAKLSAEAALRQMEIEQGDIAPVFEAIVAATPPEHIVDWRLLLRDINPNWVSPKGRIVQIGDAAHPFLPSSANGGTQALEDAVTLPICMRLAIGKEGLGGICDGARVHNKLRFDRVSAIQLTGLTRLASHTRPDAEAIKRNPNLIVNPPSDWQAHHDPAKYAVENFDECLDCLRTGKEFQNRNGPEGYVYDPKQMKELLEDQERKATANKAS